MLLIRKISEWGRATLYIVIALALIQCQEDKSTLTDATKRIIIEDVKSALHEHAAIIQEKGLIAELNFLDPSPDFFWIPPGYEQPIYYDSVAAMIEADAQRYEVVANSFDSLKVIPLSERLAIYTAKMRSICTDTAAVITETHLLETGIVIKRKDGWKLLSGQTSLIH